MMYGWDGWGWGGWVVMVLAMVVFWAVVITAVVLAIRYAVRGNNQRAQQSSAPTGAEEILAERYARGEIDEDEFRRRRATIREKLS